MKYILFLCAFLMNFLSFANTIAAGNAHSLFLDTEGNVWATGDNISGQLGLGDNVNNVQVPTKIDTLPPIKAVAAGNAHSLFLDTEGNVWATGDNKDGKLGFGTHVNSIKIPTKIEGMPGIKAVATRGFHSLFLDTEGNVWATGGNWSGQLGLGDKINRKIPTKIEGLPPIIAVSAGNSHSLFLDIDGNVWATGNNNDGQLGLGDEVNRQIPTKIATLPPIKAVVTGDYHSLFLDTEGYVWATGGNWSGQLGLGDKINRKIPTKIEGLPPIIAMSAGNSHSLFLDIDGNVWTTNNNEQFPTKINNIPRIKAVVAGYYNSLFLDTEGNVWATGINSSRELGIGNKDYIKIPTKIEGMPPIQEPMPEREKIPTKSARKIVE